MPVIRLTLRRTLLLPSGESLLVGLSVPFPEGGEEHIRRRLAPLLDTLQKAVEAHARKSGIPAESTVWRSGSGNSHRGKTLVLPARLLQVQPMVTRKGRRYVLHIEASGRKLRLVATRCELTAQLMTAGQGHLAGHIVTGEAMNMPCRAVLVRRKRHLAVLALLPPRPGEGAS